MSHMSDKSLSLTEMTDDELIDEYNKLYGQYMYYQAAEGNWAQERVEREACEHEYYACRREIRNRKLDR